MPKPIEEIDPKLADKIWRIAGSLEWDVEDWKIFYFAITKAFLQIVARRIPEDIKNSGRINVDSETGR